MITPLCFFLHAAKAKAVQSPMKTPEISDNRQKDDNAKKGDVPARVLLMVGAANFQVSLQGKWVPWKIWALMEALKSSSIETRLVVSPHYAGRAPGQSHKVHLRFRMHFEAGLHLLLRIIRRWYRSLVGRGDRPSLGRIKDDWLRCRTDWFSELLTRFEADYVIGIGLASPELLAARRNHIPTFEVQHGFVSPEVIDYQFPFERPDYFVHWFKSDEKAISEAGMVPIEAPIPDLPPASSFQSTGPLVLLQHGFIDSVDGFGMFHPDLLNTVKKLVADSKAPLIFRFHPATSVRKQRRARKVLRKKFPSSLFSYSGATNLVDLIRGAPVVVTYSSFAWTEAALVGRKTLIVDSETRILAMETDSHLARMVVADVNNESTEEEKIQPPSSDLSYRELISFLLAKKAFGNTP